MNNLKEVLNSCDCEYLPTLNEFRKIYKSKYLDYVEPEMYDKKYTKAWFEINEFGDLISQPLTLSMFVPVSEEGEVLEEPERINYKDIDGNYDEHHWEVNKFEYEKAKERVIFERCEIAEEFAARSQELQSTIEYGINNGLQLKLIK